jgi:hypothetical protein
VSHYRVLAEFPTLREAVRTAGLEPNPKGEKISTEDLLADWKRVAEKLGRRPSRAEYVREGRYSAGALTVRFGSWSGISTAKESKSGRESFFRNTGRRTRIRQTSKEVNHKGHEETQRKKKGEGGRTEEHGELMPHNFDRVPLAPVPTPLVGMRRVTEAVAQMVVNTLLSPANARAAFAGGPDFSNSNWQLAISQNQKPEFNHKGHEGTQREIGTELYTRDFADGTRLAPRGVKKDRPVMGEPFDRSPMTNAPVNELGVMVLFGMVAAGLGLQVESVQGKFPDCLAKRQVAPGKWQHLRIEFEYESKNFKLHGHDPKGCDMIVCWKHNWKDCPAEIEVVELSRLFGQR